MVNRLLRWPGPDEETPPVGRRQRSLAPFHPSCLSIVPASLTSNLPGPSTFRDLTTPLSTSIE